MKEVKKVEFIKPQMMKLHFQRFEFKYLIDSDTERDLKQYIKPYVITDPFAENTKNGSYQVVSLYYDNPFFYYYHEKNDGVKKRKKVRIRTYRNDGIWCPYCFFEIKRKYDAIILKDRFSFSFENYAQLIKENSWDGVLFPAPDAGREKTIEEFEYESKRLSISPRILVVYDREPYLGRYNKNFRVTFDKNIRAMENDNLFYEGDDMNGISPEMTVMEIKFTGTLPDYMGKVIKMFNLERSAFSKYCHGVDASVDQFKDKYYLKNNFNLSNY